MRTQEVGELPKRLARRRAVCSRERRCASRSGAEPKLTPQSSQRKADPPAAGSSASGPPNSALFLRCASTASSRKNRKNTEARETNPFFPFLLAPSCFRRFRSLLRLLQGPLFRISGAFFGLQNCLRRPNGQTLKIDDSSTLLPHFRPLASH